MFPVRSWALGRTLASQGAIDEWEGRGTGRAGPPLSSAPQHVHGASALMHTLAYRAKYHLASRHRYLPRSYPLLDFTSKNCLLWWLHPAPGEMMSDIGD